MGEKNFLPSQIEKLVAKAQSGDEKSFELLFDIFFEKISRYVYFRVANHEAEDVISDIFLKIVEHLHSYKKTPKAGFTSWIFRVAHNTVIDFYRKKKELLGSTDEEMETLFLQIPDSEPLPNEQTNTNFNLKKMLSLLKRLPAPQREILELKYLEEFSNSEIAKITGKSEGNIRVLQLRALREIRKLWGEENDE